MAVWRGPTPPVPGLRLLEAHRPRLGCGGLPARDYTAPCSLQTQLVLAEYIEHTGKRRDSGRTKVWHPMCDEGNYLLVSAWYDRGRPASIKQKLVVSAVALLDNVVTLLCRMVRGQLRCPSLECVFRTSSRLGGRHNRGRRRCARLAPSALSLLCVPTSRLPVTIHNSASTPRGPILQIRHQTQQTRLYKNPPHHTNTQTYLRPQGVDFIVQHVALRALVGRLKRHAARRVGESGAGTATLQRQATR